MQLFKHYFNKVIELELSILNDPPKNSHSECFEHLKKSVAVTFEKFVHSNVHKMGVAFFI